MGLLALQPGNVSHWTLSLLIIRSIQKIPHIACKRLESSSVVFVKVHVSIKIA